MTEVIAQFPEKAKFLFEPCRYKVAYGGRGGAKSWAIARALLILGMQRPLRILCCRETMRSIQESVHHLLEDQIDLMGFRSFYTVRESTIRGANGTEFIFAGIRQASAENLKSYEACDVAWVEEAQALSKRSWNTLIPTIRKEDSEILVSFNPTFEDDEAYQRFVLNPPKNSKVVEINWRDNPWFPKVLMEEMEDLRRRDPDECDHVYEGKLRTTVEGAIYKKEIAAAESEGRFTRVPYDPTKPTMTYWDIGPAHTRIWIAQPFPMEFRIIDFIRGELEGLAYYTKELQQRPYSYAMHVLPWDGSARELGSGRSIQEQLQSVFGKERVRCARQLSVEDGIAAVRAILPRCYFDKDKCSDGIRGLRCYQYEYDKDLRTYKRNPLHDWASHDADAFRTLAVTIREQQIPKKQEYAGASHRTGATWA